MSCTFRNELQLIYYTIRNMVLHKIMLKNLRESIQYVSQHKSEFM